MDYNSIPVIKLAEEHEQFGTEFVIADGCITYPVKEGERQ